MKKNYLFLLLTISTITATAQQKTDSARLKAIAKPSAVNPTKAAQQSVTPVLMTPPNTIKKTATAEVLPPAPVKGTVTDIDGNVYQTLQIGTQVWMIENLKTTRLNDGTPIVDPDQYLISKNYFGLQPGIFPNGGWNVDVADPNNPGNFVLRSTAPAYCFYNNQPSNKIRYGHIYNWYAVNSGKLAPAGWHVPTDADWDILLRYVADPGNSNPYHNCGGNIKSVGGWNTPNTGATNKSGFSAYAGGYRGGPTATFSGLGDQAYFWSATPKGQYDASAKSFSKGHGGLAVVSSHGSRISCSVRCVKN